MLEMQNSPGCISYIWKILCPFSNPQTSGHTKSFPGTCGWPWWITEAESLSGAFGTRWPKPPSAGELLPRAQSGRERLLLASPRNHPRRASTEETEAVQLTRAQVDHNYARSAYTEQGLPLLRSGESKVLRRDGMQCNSNFQAILTTFPNHSLQMNKSLFSNTSTQDGTSHLARKIQNVSF